MLTNPDFDPLKMLNDLMDHTIRQDEAIHNLVRYINDLNRRVAELEAQLDPGE